MDHAIAVDGLSKYYRLGSLQKGWCKTLRESITEAVTEAVSSGQADVSTRRSETGEWLEGDRSLGA